MRMWTSSKMVESQVQTYRLDKGESPGSINDLKDEDYLQEYFEGENLRCPGGEYLILEGDKVITVNE
ncbi:MAG: hypothetical protein LPK00_03025 [Bacillaceae bacterium]|nr:hypothetical protein [Bacillaceae bacterium]